MSRLAAQHLIYDNALARASAETRVNLALEQRLWPQLCLLCPGQLDSKATMPRIANQQKFFIRLGTRIRVLRREHGYSQEDMISFGFSARHWQQIERGRPITVLTLLRICAALEISIERLVRGLDRGIYKA